MNVYKQQVMIYLKQHKATIDGGAIAAPRGHIWRSTGWHLILLDYLETLNETQQWFKTYQRIIDGYEKCKYSDCEICK